MAYLSTITNEQTAELPSAHFDGNIIVVEREEQIASVCRDLASEKIIGFDTETRPSFKAGVTNKVALLQLSTSKRCYLIRLCRMRLHKDILRILSNPNILKIGADVAGDIRALHVLRHFTERGFIDLQHIAPEWGIEDKSLRKISAIVLQERVSKAQRLSNWEAATLTPQQQMYAATDAWVCIKIYEKLMASPRVNAKPEQASSEPTIEDKKPTTNNRTPRNPERTSESRPKREGKANFATKHRSLAYRKRFGGKPHRKNHDNNEKQI